MQLLAVSGQFQGSAFDVADDRLSIGSDPSNSITVVGDLVAKHHCYLQREADRLKLVDTSDVGTFVNGLPAKEQLLRFGDLIRVGESVFRFEDSQTDDSTASVTLEDDRAGDSMVIRSPQLVLETLPQHGMPVQRDLKTLVQLSTVIHSIRALYESKHRQTREIFERHLLDFIFGLVPAQRGAVLITDDFAEDFTSVYGYDGVSGTQNPVPVSRAIVDRALTDGVAVIQTDGETNSNLSVIAVPLIAGEKVLGVIYLDSADPHVSLDENHLQLLTAVAGIAGFALESARNVERLQSENRRLQDEIDIQHDMVGESPRMAEVYRFVARVASSDATVLIRGESGTGKELVARAIHRNSLRNGKPFVAINCAALTETLLESELFGHEKGAFTGAVVQKKGKLEVASGGTVFLDEIGEVSPLMQAKLLRVLQEREFERVGGTRPIHVDIRLLAATNRDLSEAMRGGTFRQDLYYRLNVVSVFMPALRERREDIPLLAKHFAVKHSATCNRRIQSISKQALAALTNYSWPGNVRELENAIERAIVLGSTDEIMLEDLPEILLETESPAESAQFENYHQAVHEAKKQLILNAVEQAKGNYAEAARLLGLNPTYLHRLIRNMNLRVLIK